jgi:2-dehydropantoate 2-reductase
MKILVLGAGAIGSIFSGLLAKSGHEVILLGRNPHMDTINRRGLTIGGIWGEHHIVNLRGYTSLKEIREDGHHLFDLILLTVKSFDTEFMIKEYLTYFPNDAPMISLQNGLGNLEEIVEYLGREKAIGGRVIFGAEIMEPGRVKVTVYADKVVLGGVKDGIDPKKVEEMAETFSLSGIPTQATMEIDKYIWGKVIYNSALNALGSILEVNYGELLKKEETKSLMNDIVVEIFKVVKKEKVNLFWNEPKEYLSLLFNELIPATYDHFPSMFHDIKKKRKTEIESINGAIVRKGEKLGLSLPVNKIITYLVKVKERIAFLRA